MSGNWGKGTKRRPPAPLSNGVVPLMSPGGGKPDAGMEADQGIMCAGCGCKHLPVEEEKPLGDGIARKHICRNCGRPLRTLERDSEAIDRDEAAAAHGGRRKWDGRPGLGLTCGKCGSHDFETEDTDRVAGGVRRYRRCRQCGTKKTTYEK